MAKTEDGNVTGWQLYKRVLRYAKPLLWALILGLAGNAMYSSVDAGMTYLLKPLVNKGFIARDTTFIAWLPVLIIGMVLLRAFFNYIGSYFMAVVSRSVVMNFRQEIFRHFLKVPATYYDSSSTGEMLAVLLYNVDQISSITATTLTRIIQASFLIVGLLIVMFTVSWKLTLIFFVIAPLMALIMRVSSRHIRKLNRAVQKGMGDVTSIAEESIVGYRVVRAFGGQDYEAKKFDKAVDTNRRRELKLAILSVFNTSGVQIVGSVALAIIIYLATAYPHTVVSAGGFVTLMASMLGLLKPLKQITNVNSKIQAGLAGAQGVFGFLDQQTEIDNGVVDLERAKGLVEYRDINFTYPGTEREVLHDISFNIPVGHTVALVGRSGSGKSTLANMLPRFYDYHEGDITLDGKPLKEYSLQSLRQQISIVTQHVTLFNDTIANNVAYGSKQNASEEEIIAALKAAHAWEFIEALPETIQTLIGENGLLLSGGQRQRIAIARAILKDAPILILDEATSALDSEAEKHIQAALQELMQNRTTLVIAHRLSTIENADQIIVMDQGKIVETGDHQTLLKENGHYKNLYTIQFSQEKGQ